MPSERPEGFRFPKKLRSRLARAAKSSGQSKTELVETALEEFFTNHKTTEKIIAAIISRRTAAQE